VVLLAVSPILDSLEIQAGDLSLVLLLKYTQNKASAIREAELFIEIDGACIFFQTGKATP
jgi:hypothetical protein